MTPPFGQYTALSASLAGSLRHSHSRLVEFAEEIAFLRGEETEKMLLEREYAGLVKHENTVLMRKWWFGCVEEGIIKWLWGSFGLVVCAIPTFFKLPGISSIDLGGRTESLQSLSSFREAFKTKLLFELRFRDKQASPSLLVWCATQLACHQPPLTFLSQTHSAASCIPTRICRS